MMRDVLAAVAVSSMGMCQSNTPNSEPTPSGLTCHEYQLIIDVELMANQRCNSDDECTQLLSEKEFDWVVVDHYGINKVWHQQIRDHTKKLLVINHIP